MLKYWSYMYIQQFPNNIIDVPWYLQNLMYSFQIGKFTRFYEIGLLPNVFKEMFLMANQVHSYITRNSNTFCIISCPNKYTGKTFWYKTSRSKMFQFNYKVLLLDLFLNLHVHVHWKHFSLADSPVLQWCFSAPVVARLITWHEFFFLNGHLEMLLELLNFFRTKKFS